MPDFTIEIFWQCQTPKHANVGGYEQRNVFSERDWPTCTCPAYTYGKRTVNFGGRMVPPECKHIIQAQIELCSWHQMIDGGEVDRDNPVCPRCGGPAELVRVAV